MFKISVVTIVSHSATKKSFLNTEQSSLCMCVYEHLEERIQYFVMLEDILNEMLINIKYCDRY